VQGEDQTGKLAGSTDRDPAADGLRGDAHARTVHGADPSVHTIVEHDARNAGRAVVDRHVHRTGRTAACQCAIVLTDELRSHLRAASGTFVATGAGTGATRAGPAVQAGYPLAGVLFFLFAPAHQRGEGDEHGWEDRSEGHVTLVWWPNVGKNPERIPAVPPCAWDPWRGPVQGGA